MKTSNVFYYAALVTAMVLVTSCAGIMSRGDSSQGQRLALFDGQTLEGWTVINCEATVDDGDILLVSGNGLVQTEEQYGDFVLDLEWKALREGKWDSGIYFRYDSVPAGRPWPERYQVNLLKGQEGNVASLEGARSEGLTNEGQWNRFRLSVQGTKVSLEINGQPAWEADGLAGPETGFIALQAEVPGGGQFRFRHIYLTPLD